MQRDFQRVAVVNRGEPAMRVIHAVREFNEEHGTHLRTIALFTDCDRHAMFVREADEAFGLGTAQFVDARDGVRKNRYLDYAALEHALRETRAEAVWPGWGLVAEHPAFVDLCDRLGVVFIGPSADVMRRLGDKISSKRLAEEAGVPVAPWSGGPVETLAEARTHARRLGLPLMIKASAGGGGRGIRKALAEADVPDAFERARSEALKSFGDATVFMETLVTGAHHIEVQIMGDGARCWALGVRDCTLQRRHQKVMEESPSPVLTPEQDRVIREAAVRMGEAVGYRSAGTVEFLYEPEVRAFSFMEVNARLQVEHPVTEVLTGLDLVKLQLHVARGGMLEGDPPEARGHAVEVRLNAEDPDRHFAPAPGTIALLRLPSGPGVRVDAGVEEGDTIPPEFDSMVAKIITYGHDRAEALGRQRRALSECVFMSKSGTSNKGFLLDLLDRPDVKAGAYDVGYLDRLILQGGHVSLRHAEIALLQAAIDAYDAELDVEKARFFTSAARGRPAVQDHIGRTVELSHRGHPWPLTVYRLGPTRYRVDVQGRHLDVHVERPGTLESRLTCGDRHHRLFTALQGAAYLVEVDGVPHLISRDRGGIVRAPAPAVVVSLHVQPGDRVEPGERLAVLEAMKMELSVQADFGGTVREVHVRNNMQVGTGTPLLVIEPDQEATFDGGEASASFDALGGPVSAERSPEDRCAHNLDQLKQLMLGFDVDPDMLHGILTDQHLLCRHMPPDFSPMLASEEEILTIFADSGALYQKEPDPGEGDEAVRRSPESYLFTYLRDPGAQGAGLPADFVDKLERMLAHYGVRGLRASPELRESLFRLHTSHQRMAQQVAPVLSILQRRIEHVDVLAPEASPAFRALLDRTITETQRLFPSVNDLAREVRYRYFRQPLLERVIDEAYARAAGHLRYLETHPDAPDRDEHVRALVDCPQPLKSMLSGRFETADRALRGTMLEVMTRRYYRIRNLTDVRSRVVDGQSVITAAYDHQGAHVHVITTHAAYEDLARSTAALKTLLDDLPSRDDVVLDIYVWHRDAFGDTEAMQRHIRDVLDASGFPRPLRRIVVAVAGPESGRGMHGILHFTFRPSQEGYWEEKFYKGVLDRSLHPMMAKRLHLERLQHFDVERLPSPEDVYLLRAVAHDNPKDERLIGVAEVRDLTPLRDASGRVVQLPQLERMLMEVLSNLRHVQARRPLHQRLHWNRILLYVWPPFTLRPDEVNDLATMLAPAAQGLGLETVVLHVRIPNDDTGTPDEQVIYISNVVDGGLRITFEPPSMEPIEPLTEYEQQVVRLRRRGLIYPYDIIKMLTPPDGDGNTDLPPGTFVEYDLDADQRLVPVDRPYGQNTCNVVVGLVTNTTPAYPDGMERVILLGDPSRGMGNLAEPECRRIIGALDLARERGLPLEWFAVSAGARIAMDSGTENMDWIALVLRRLVEFTQDGGEVNVVVVGINVGAQPYWNAEATMLMHTRGILVMTPDAAMVLTGKQALDYSGGVSAEDNLGIGGYERIMGPNGQAQYFAQTIFEACQILLRHYDHTYVVPGERFPRRAATSDPHDRDVCTFPHGRVDGHSFASLGDVFSDETNPGRKKPFDIRKVMRAVSDQDHPPLERWPGMQDAEIAVVWDAHVGGFPVCLIGLESRPLPRLGFVPADGPDQWTGGTLFPRSSKKVARALNAASGNRPVVVLANLSGFDGSPESMRTWQLEYGAEIGRAVVNFDGPMVFCVISRYHGGAFVVFSNALNERLEIAALEGTYASVIGGAPAAAVVFAGEVRQRTQADSRLLALDDQITRASESEKVRLRSLRDDLYQQIHSEKLGEVAEEFDAVHSVHRAKQVGSVHRIIPPSTLRPYVIDAVARGMGKTTTPSTKTPARVR